MKLFRIFPVCLSLLNLPLSLRKSPFLVFDDEYGLLQIGDAVWLRIAFHEVNVVIVRST